MKTQDSDPTDSLKTFTNELVGRAYDVNEARLSLQNAMVPPNGTIPDGHPCLTKYQQAVEAFHKLIQNGGGGTWHPAGTSCSPATICANVQIVNNSTKPYLIDAVIVDGVVKETGITTLPNDYSSRSSSSSVT